MINIRKFLINLREFLGLNYYISSLDEFLNKVDASIETYSLSQRKEIAKYSRIHALRDNREVIDRKDVFWEKF